MYLKFIIILFFVFLSGYVLGEKYKISGEVVGQNSGEVVLLTKGERQIDTIGRCRIEQGKFQMEGSLDKACVAILVTKNRKLPEVLLLDSEHEFEVYWPESGPAVVEGGKLQNVLNEYLQMMREGNKRLKELNLELKAAAEANHMKTVGELKEKITLEKIETQKELRKLTDDNRGTLFSAYILTSGMERMNLEQLKTCYSRLDEKERLLEPGCWLQTLIEKLEKVNIGSVAPDFTLHTPEGKAVSMYSVKGKLKIIDFWASWCGPCRLENPNMVALYRDYKDKGMAIVSVSLDNKKEAWTTAIEKDGLDWLHLSSLEGWESPVVKQYGVDAVPAIFVLDENNRIIARQIRGEKLRTLVEERLK